MTIPDQISDLKNLETLHLDQNHINEISESIAGLSNLKKLSLANNDPLTTLPKNLFLIPTLQELNLKECSVT